MNKLWASQLGALVHKEFKEIARDPSSYIVGAILPVTFLLLFGFGITLDAGNLKLAIVDQSKGPNSLSIASDFAHSPSFTTVNANDIKDAATMMRDSEVQGVVVFQENFDREIARGSSGSIQILIDGSEPNSAEYIKNYSTGLITTWQQNILPAGMSQPISVQTRYWYNPAAESKKFLVPGAMTVIMTLIGTLLTSLVFAREWERGTMEALIATPVTRMQLLLGKLIPYFCMGMMGMFICATATITIFDVPMRGSWHALLLIASVFMLCALGQGLLISVLLKQQLVAAEAGLFTGFLPALILSGFVFDISSMAAPMRALTYILPARYFNTCLRTIFLAGDDWSIFGPCLLFMAILAILLLTVVYHKLDKRLAA